MKKNTALRMIIIILIGILVTTVAYVGVLNPHNVSVGGVTGLSVVMEERFNIPYTASALAFNGALYIWGIKVKGKRYIVRTLLAMLSLTILLDININIPVLVHSRTAAMIFGSILSGIGYGLIVSQDTSTGGSDLLGMIINKKHASVSTGTVMSALDFLVVGIDSAFSGIANLPFSIVAVLLCNASIDITAWLVAKDSLPGWVKKIRGCVERINIKNPAYRKVMTATLCCGMAIVLWFFLGHYAFQKLVVA